jgi:hypothetical protein
MNSRKLLAMALDPSRILAARGFAVDPWQREVLLSPRRELLLNCSRQAGKSTVVAALALHMACSSPVRSLSSSLRGSGNRPRPS